MPVKNSTSAKARRSSGVLSARSLKNNNVYLETKERPRGRGGGGGTGRSMQFTSNPSITLNLNLMLRKLT